MSSRGGRPPADGAAAAGDMFLELRQIGPQTRVSAIDAATGVEVTLAVPSNLPRHDIERLARRKLDRRMGRTPA